MTKIGEIERMAQNRIVNLFVEDLDYVYLGNWEKRENKKPIEDDILKANLIERGLSSPEKWTVIL